MWDAVIELFWLSFDVNWVESGIWIIVFYVIKRYPVIGLREWYVKLNWIVLKNLTCNRTTKILTTCGGASGGGGFVHLWTTWRDEGNWISLLHLDWNILVENITIVVMWIYYFNLRSCILVQYIKLILMTFVTFDAAFFCFIIMLPWLV